MPSAFTPPSASVTPSNTVTFTNKRNTERVGSTASSATPTINTDDYDEFKITALAANITSMTTNLSGTPNDGDKLLIRIKDNGTTRTITWGSSFANLGGTLPTSTTVSKWHSVALKYYSDVAKWCCLSALVEP